MSAASFTPVRQARASGEIVSQIERAIFDGELQTGDRLESERELAERFGVSRITVRDALRVLEARGLVHVKVGASGGAFVSDTNVDQVAESISTMIQLRRMTLSGVAEARTVVETATSELAAERADAAAILRIEQTVEKGRSVVREQAPHTEASMDFHVAVADAAKNELLAATVAAYRDLLVQTLHDMRDVRSDAEGARGDPRRHQVARPGGRAQADARAPAGFREAAPTLARDARAGRDHGPGAPPAHRLTPA